MGILRGLVALLAVGSALAAPAERRQAGRCTSPKQRKAWHTLTNTEKKAYIDAELCLMKKPSNLKLRGARTKFDELQSVHVLAAEIAHFTGAFLPWHRLQMYAHEELLETLCGYTGGQPYWQQQRDAGKFLTSDVLDPVTGFGGNGVGATLCITTGPFANYTNSMGPGYVIADHCIQRQVNEIFSRAAAQTEVDRCMRATTFIQLWNCLEGSPHSAGHGGIGAQMFNGESSPGDPIFYLHHTWLDKLWWDWQAKGLPGRLNEMGGRNKWGAGGIPGGGAIGGGFGAAGIPAGFSKRPADLAPAAILGDPAGDVTMTHVIEMYGIVPDRTVGELMDIRNDLLCYEYVNPPA